MKTLCLPAALGLSLALASTVHAQAARTWSVRSPDGALSITVRQPGLDDTSAPVGSLFYTVRRGPKTIIGDSPLGLTLGSVDGDLSTGLRFVGASSRSGRDSYTLISGKTRQVRAAFNEGALSFRNPMGRTLQVLARAYNDGVAFRYVLPATQRTAATASVASEASGFRVPMGSKGWVAPFVSNYEQLYPQGIVGENWKSGDWALPATFDVGGGQFAVLAESAVGDTYCSTHLGGDASGVFGVRLDGGASSSLPWAMPWRVIITGGLAQVTQSMLVQSLAPPAVPGDTSWIHPGRVTWSWWSQGTGDPALHKKYVDFASGMGWEYDLVDDGWTSWNNRNPAPQIEELVRYGRERKVGILLWAHHNDLDTPEERAARLPLWKSWGIAGVKVDFFDSDSQRTMAIREAILKACWENKLMVNFHGDQSPRGQERMWPHFLTREGVRGAENFRPAPRGLAAYNATLPFTRNLTGPMDYTPVTFSTQNRTTTAAHELALSVVFESGWQHLADSPETYMALPVGREFLKQVPADWDETLLVDGYPAQLAVLARRKGAAWFVGGIVGSAARTVRVPLRFLGAGRFQIELYRDGAGHNDIVAEQRQVTARDVITVQVPADGGFAMRVAPGGSRH